MVTDKSTPEQASLITFAEYKDVRRISEKQRLYLPAGNRRARRADIFKALPTPRKIVIRSSGFREAANWLGNRGHIRLPWSGGDDLHLVPVIGKFLAAL